MSDESYDTLKVYYTRPVYPADRINYASGTMETENAERILEVDSGPGFDPQGFVGGVQTATAGTIAWVKTFADEQYVFTPIENKAVSRVFPGEGLFYVQESDRSCGIRVRDSQAALALEPGDVVKIWQGTIRSQDGERVSDSVFTEKLAFGDSPRPIGLANRSVGGGPFNSCAPGPDGGDGLNNTGLLLRAWGQVTSVGSDHFYLDDGSTLADGSGATRVQVEGTITYLPDTGDYVAVTGISGLRTVSASLARVVRLANNSDFTPVSPARPDGVQAFATGEHSIAIF